MQTCSVKKHKFVEVVSQQVYVTGDFTVIYLFCNLLDEPNCQNSIPISDTCK